MSMYKYNVEDICPVFETLEFFNRKWGFMYFDGHV